MGPSVNSTASSDDSEIDLTLQLLKEGKEKIQLDERYRNVTLVLGITGAGKSTFVQWLAGDNSKLFSEIVPGSFNDYIIKDDSRISNSTTKSMTIFPELIVDPQTDQAFYDCPGFSDTRSTSNDIAGTYFVKTVADYAENVRLLLLIGYPAVRVGVDRRQFIELLKHSTNLVRNVPKFGKSIALVVTKVDNTPYRADENGKMIYIPDESIISSIAQFMINVRQELKEAKANQNFIELTNGLLQKDGENYSKIAIFRRPDMEGPLSEIPLLLAGKAKLNQMVNQLELTPIEQDDFGYSISDTSKNAVYKLENIINDRVWQDAEAISDLVKTSYRKSVDEIRNKINSFPTATIESLDANLEEARAFAAKLKTVDRIISQLSDVPNVTPRALAEKLNFTLNALKIDTLSDNVERIALNVDHLEFFQNVTDSSAPVITRPWQNLLKGIVDSLGYSGSIQNEINQSAIKLVETVQLSIKGLAVHLWEAKLDQMQSMDIQLLPGQLEQELAIVRNQTNLHPNNIEQLATSISKNVRTLGLETHVVQGNMLTMLNSAKYLSYLQAISDRQLDTWSPEWVSPLIPTMKMFFDSLEWYRYLNGLYSKLGEYEFQREPSQYNVASLDDWGVGQAKQQDIRIDQQNFNQFLNITSKYNITGLDGIKATQAAGWQLSELNRVLSLTLKHGKAVPDCSLLGTIAFTGDYVKLSDLKEKVVDMCESNSTSSVNIFASNTVFVDGDLSGLGDKLKLTILAPKWEVIGKRTINLNGTPGKSRNPAKAADSETLGIDPGMGVPGFAGGSAGSFLGIGRVFVNKDGLTITADGGAGGDGQEGGDGPPGVKGEDAEPPSSNCQITGKHERLDNETTSHTKWLENWTYYTYYISGKEGTAGEDGGDGGAGGTGGNPGQISSYNLDESAKQVVATHQGNAGSGGRGGLGGYYGVHGNDLRAKCDLYFYLGYKSWTYHPKATKTIEHYPSMRVQSGEDGANRLDIQKPEPAAIIVRPAAIINEYKAFMRGGMIDANGRFKRNFTISMLDQLETKASDMYDALALADDFVLLEEQSRILRNTPDSVHFYQSLSNRISTYAVAPRPTEKTDQYKMLLSYLSAATLGKLYNLQAGPETNLIIDVEGYLSFVEANMNALNQLQAKHNEHEIVQKHKKAYRENIEKQIEEARSFIEKDIKPEFDRIGKNIDKDIGKLIDDTVRLEKAAKENKKELIETRKKLQKNFLLRGIFSGIKIASQVVSFIGPPGAAIGTVVSGATSITEGLVLDDQTGEGKEFKMPPGIKDNIKLVEADYKEFFANSAKDFKSQLDEIQKEIKTAPELNDLAKKLDYIGRRLPTDPDDPNFTTKLEELNAETRKALKDKETEMKANKENGEKWAENSVKVLNFANKLNQFGSTVADVYSKLRGDKAKIAATDKALKDMDEKIKQIDAYKQEIRNKMAPQMNRLMKDFKQINRNLDNKSLVALDVQQWKAQGMLRDLKVSIQAFVKGQNVEADLMRCFEKLDEAMSVIIKIYDRIQNFQQQQQLTDFMANIVSPRAKDVKIEDEELALAVSKLNIVIQSNVVLQQFDATVISLKQMVFPHARHYLDSLTLPAKASLNDTYIAELVVNANAALVKMKTKVVENRTQISKFDQYSHNAVFNSVEPCIQAPFYLWSNGEHANALSKLLAGESVTLKADIRHSDPAKDAIKFRKVELYFKAKNATLQPDLNTELKKFMVSAVHLGNSYYRYGGKYYVIDHDAQNIKYSFLKNENGLPNDHNEVYRKIEQGNLMLSPYAHWQITLTRMNQTVTFDQLAAYRDEVDLELVGEGSYTESQAALLVDNLQIDKFYSEYVDDSRADESGDLVEQNEGKQLFSAHVAKQVHCRQYLAKQNALKHRFQPTRLPNQANQSNSTGNAPSYISRIRRAVSNYFGGASASPSVAIDYPQIEYPNQQQSNNPNSLGPASNSLDVQANLLMGQLIVGLIAGKNKTLSSESYMSPELTHNAQVETLAHRVVPILSRQSAQYRSNQIQHNPNIEWHQKLFPLNGTISSDQN